MLPFEPKRWKEKKISQSFNSLLLKYMTPEREMAHILVTFYDIWYGFLNQNFESVSILLLTTMIPLFLAHPFGIISRQTRCG